MNSKEKLHLTIKLTLWIFFISLGYAILRYNIGKGVPWEHLPLYVANKAFAITSAYLLSISIAGKALRMIKIKLIQRIAEARISLGLAGGFLMGLHILMSLISLQPNMYKKFFGADQTLNLIGELTMLSGVFAAGAFLFLSITSVSNYLSQLDGSAKFNFRAISLFGLFALLLHTVFMGYTGFFDVSHWPVVVGISLPPISLLSAIGIVKGIAFGLKK